MERRFGGGRSGSGRWLGRELPARDRGGRRNPGAREVLHVRLLARHGGAQLSRGDARGQGRGDPDRPGAARRALPVRDPGQRRDLAQVCPRDPATDVPRDLCGLVSGRHEFGGRSTRPHAKLEVRGPAARASAGHRRAGLGTEGGEMAQFSPVTGRYVTMDVIGDECKVFFLETGQGRPLVCQHTAGCHNHQWRDLLEDEEIPQDYRVIAYDLVRHGKSDPPKNREWWKEEYRLTADYYTAFIVAFCDALELEDPIFMGSSFGGNVSLQLAWRHPERFGGVIPVEAADYSPGFYLDWWQHPHANAAQVCASGVWDLMAPQS